MNQTDLIRYGGRAGGALAAVMLGKHHVGVAGLVALGVVGWVVGGFISDRFATSNALATVGGGAIN